MLYIMYSYDIEHIFNKHENKKNNSPSGHKRPYNSKLITYVNPILNPRYLLNPT